MRKLQVEKERWFTPKFVLCLLSRDHYNTPILRRLNESVLRFSLTEVEAVKQEVDDETSITQEEEFEMIMNNFDSEKEIYKGAEERFAHWITEEEFVSKDQLSVHHKEVEHQETNKIIEEKPVDPITKEENKTISCRSCSKEFISRNELK